MQRASKEYKQAMKKGVRNRSYIAAGIGIVNQQAQADASLSGTFSAWSNAALPLENREPVGEYATMEQHFFKADGSLLFLPEIGVDQYVLCGITTASIAGSVRVDFGASYAMKGLMIDFGESYPRRLTLKTEAYPAGRSYNNSKQIFVTEDFLGETDYLIIEPKVMSGGQQRTRIRRITMGVGFTYTNSDVESVTLSEEISPISAELPAMDIDINIVDYSNRYHVDDEESFMGYLTTGQEVTLSFGMELDNGKVEWIPAAKGYLDSWSSQKGKVSFKAKDLFAFLEGEYSAGNTIHSRTAYQEAVSILTDAGLSADAYEIDEYLKKINLINPMPVAPHKECLQLLCNACRCILYQDVSGKLIIRTHFDVIRDPEAMQITTKGESRPCKAETIRKGSGVVYADLSAGLFAMDGSLFFPPENGETGHETGFVSGVADAQGAFGETNPEIALQLETGCAYSGVHVRFDATPPESLIVQTSLNGQQAESITFTYPEKESFLEHDFKRFDAMKIVFTKAASHARVLVRQVALKELSDYKLTREQMTEEPTGCLEKRVRDLYVRIYEFDTDEEGNPTYDTENPVYYKLMLNSSGEDKYCENQLVANREQAAILAQWLGNYYANHITYSAGYRGEPRIHASDILYLESEVIPNLQTEVERCTLSFDGALSGSLELRRALPLISVKPEI